MLRAMTSAPLGDDVFGDDPTVNRLEETAAGRMGKEAALFVASGTMGNLLALLVSARPGQEVIADADSHVFLNEAAGAAMVGGIQIRQVHTERGVLSPAQVLAALRPADDDHQPLTAGGIYQAVARRGRQCGVSVYPHRFRHHFSHTWLDRGGAERDLMELNGWTSPQMLTRYGASARGTRARRSYDRIMNDST